MPFVDDELDAAASYEVDRHLAACPGCRAEAESIRSYDARLRGACRGEGAQGAACQAMRARLAAALDAEIARSTRRRSVGRLVRRGLAAAAVAVVAVGLVIGLLPGPAAADFAADHVACIQMRSSWVADPAMLAELCKAAAGAHARVVSLARSGYALRSGAMCEIDGRRFLHLVYAAPGREPVSIFVGRRLGGLAGRLRAVERRDKDGQFDVVRLRCPAGNDYVLVAGAGSPAEVLADAVKPQIGR